MKICLLFFVAAVWCMLPSDGEAAASHVAKLKTVAKRSASLFTKDVHSPLNKKALRQARRLQRNLLRQREVLDIGALFNIDEAEMEEYREMSTAYLQSSEAAAQLRAAGISLKDLNAIVDADDDIPPRDKDLFKVLFLLFLSGELED